MTKRTRIATAVVATLVGVPAIAYAGVLGYLFVVPAVEAQLRATRFDSARWKAKALDGNQMWPTRLRMVDDLLASGRLLGLTRAQVEQLLGPPDDTPYFKDWSMVYWLGPERGYIRIDSEWLVLRVDDDRVITEFRLLRD